MQVLKDEIREKIHKAAVAEFMALGYKGASMRGIAKASEISVGNLYRYHANKESLFDEIVGPAYKELTKEDLKPPNLELLQVNIMEHMDFIVDLIHQSKKGTRDSLYIILDKSKGSKYENVKDDLIKKVEKQLLGEFVSDTKFEEELIRGHIFIKALATSAVEGTCTIIRESENDKEFIENMLQYFSFTSKSILKTLLDIKNNNMNYRRLSHEEVYRNIMRHTNCGSDSL